MLTNDFEAEVDRHCKLAYFIMTSWFHDIVYKAETLIAWAIIASHASLDGTLKPFNLKIASLWQSFHYLVNIHNRVIQLVFYQLLYLFYTIEVFIGT